MCAHKISNCLHTKKFYPFLIHVTFPQILKLYAWEPSFQNSLIRTREKELDQVKRINIINALSNIAWFLCPYLVSHFCDAHSDNWQEKNFRTL